jgi:neopullulanase
VYVYFRYTDNESIMVVINNNKDKQILKIGRFQESIQNYKFGKDILSGEIVDLKNDLSIEGKSVLILELK